MDQPLRGTAPKVAIACGGTGGHLFPGIAVAEALAEQGCDAVLLVSAKEIDQQTTKSLSFETITLPAVGLQAGGRLRFVPQLLKSLRQSRKLFRKDPPAAVLATGGFTSAPPILAGWSLKKPAYLHESNSIPGRAIRWLAPFATAIFAGFPSAQKSLRKRNVLLTGTPVRTELKSIEPAAARIALGLNPEKPVLLVMGGSQGAAAINRLALEALPALAQKNPELQFIHLTGPKEREKVRDAYAARQRKAAVLPFLTEMELALGAATVALSRAGASSLAEFAAVELPSILIPYPSAADNHQFFNARAFMETGAARQLEQLSATPEYLATLVTELIDNAEMRHRMRTALRAWQTPDAAEKIAREILAAIPGFRAEQQNRAAATLSGRKNCPAHKKEFAPLAPRL